MASKPRRITTGKKTTWSIEVCVGGVRKSKRLDSKNDALNWAMDQEAQLADGDVLVHGKTVADAMQRYANEVSSKKKGERWERIRLTKIGRDPIARVMLIDLRLSDAESYRDHSIGKGLKPGTVIREMNLLKHVIRQAVKWGYLRKYPWDQYENPKADPPRDRIISEAEISAMTLALGLKNESGDFVDVKYKKQQVAVLFLLAIETAMRLGEMCLIQWKYVDLTSSTVHLPAHTTKTGVKRTVPLSDEAVALFKLMIETHAEKVFTVASGSASSIFYNHRVQIDFTHVVPLEQEEFSLHDTRHTAITRLADWVDVMELQRITGHQDINELRTYYNKPATDISAKIKANKAKAKAVESAIAKTHDTLDAA